MAAHEIPPEFRSDRAEWVRIVADEIVPGSPGSSRASATSSASKGSSPFRNRGASSRRRAGRAWACGCADELALSGGAMLAPS
jgi:hypothetical protein